MSSPSNSSSLESKLRSSVVESVLLGWSDLPRGTSRMALRSLLLLLLPLRLWAFLHTRPSSCTATTHRPCRTDGAWRAIAVGSVVTEERTARGYRASHVAFAKYRPPHPHPHPRPTPPCCTYVQRADDSLTSLMSYSCTKYGRLTPTHSLTRVPVC